MTITFTDSHEVTSMGIANAISLPVPAPKAVLAAKSGARLHDALLSSQGTLLDALRPHRLTYGDRFD
jgi:hypothetical protein